MVSALQVVELDPGNASAQQNVQRLTPLAQQEQERMKDEMIGELDRPHGPQYFQKRPHSSHASSVHCRELLGTGQAHEPGIAFKPVWMALAAEASFINVHVAAVQGIEGSSITAEN